MLSRYRVLTLGSAEQAQPVLNALREQGVQAWSDRFESVQFDRCSVDWADAVVIMHNQPIALDAGPLADVACWPLPKLLLTSVPLSSAERIELLNGGFDSVLEWPCSTRVVAATVARFVDRSAIPFAVRQRLFA